MNESEQQDNADEVLQLALKFLILNQHCMRLMLNKEIELIRRDELEDVVNTFRTHGKRVSSGWSLDGSCPAVNTINQIRNGTFTGESIKQPYITEDGLRRAENRLEELSEKPAKDKAVPKPRIHDELLLRQFAFYFLETKGNIRNPPRYFHNLNQYTRDAYKRTRKVDSAISPKHYDISPTDPLLQRVLKEEREKFKMRKSVD